MLRMSGLYWQWSSLCGSGEDQVVSGLHSLQQKVTPQQAVGVGRRANAQDDVWRVGVIGK